MENQPTAPADRKEKLRALRARYRAQRRALRDGYIAEKYALLGRPPQQAAYTLGEELVSAISHGAGTLLAAAALILMVIVSVRAADPWQLSSAIVYGVTLLLLYLMSTLYHGLRPNRAKGVFQVFDHCSIYLLIAGTYTPYTLVTLRGGWGWTLFAVVWAAAVLGIVFSAVSLKRFRLFGIICYVCMGWVIIVAIRPLLRSLAPGGLLLLLLGGLCYTLGILLYRAKKRRYTHAAWHLCVLAGSVLHFFSIWGYVLG
jgi:hemolysin III